MRRFGGVFFSTAVLALDSVASAGTGLVLVLVVHSEGRYGMALQAAILRKLWPLYRSFYEFCVGRPVHWSLRAGACSTRETSVGASCLSAPVYVNGKILSPKFPDCVVSH